MKDKKYDAWLHWSITERCNLSCYYCINQTPNGWPKDPNKIQKTNKLLSFINPLRPPVHKIHNEIRLNKLLSTLDSTELIYNIWFTGGEPFVVPNLVEICKQITQKHFVSFNSNLLMNDVMTFSRTINPNRVVKIVASFHIQELNRLHLTSTFIDHYKQLMKKGFPVFAEEVAHPSTAPKAKYYTRYYKNLGLTFKYLPYIGLYKGKLYPYAYTKEELRSFNIKESRVALFNHKGKYCNAGFNTGVVDQNGDIRKCYDVNQPIGNIYKKIQFSKKMSVCPSDRCGCAFHFIDPYLFSKACKKNNIPTKKIP